MDITSLKYINNYQIFPIRNKNHYTRRILFPQINLIACLSRLMDNRISVMQLKIFRWLDHLTFKIRDVVSNNYNTGMKLGIWIY